MRAILKFYSLILIISVSCIKEIEPVITDPVVSRVSANGFFIVNEGNFGWGNGSLTYFSYDSLKVYSNIFKAVNSRPLGDVPFSMMVHNDNIYIVVNNSEKIEVIDRRSLESKKTIAGFISPRQIAVTGEKKAYVTSIYSDSIRILDLSENRISGYINIENTSEAIVVHGQKAFIANWIGGRKVFVVDTGSDQVIDSVEVGIEPESMALDKNGMIWVLCNGGWTRDNFAELICLNPQTHALTRRYTFPSKTDSPLNLISDSDGDTLLFIDGGIKCMDINSTELPSSVFIDQADNLFYRMAVNPVNGNIVATDALDYQQQGNFMIFSRKGIFISEYQAGLIPGNICFMVNQGHITE